MTRETTRQKIILVTGASGGIGAATARLLAAEGHHVVLGARRTGRLEALVAEIRAAGGSADCHALDVTDADDVQTFVLAAHRKHGRVDVIVNNAGVMPLSRLDALKLKEWDRMIDVNVRGVLYGIAAVLPLMQRAGQGHVINVSSTGGHAVGPASAVYCATSFAVRAISEGLRQEEKNLRVTVISPGVTASGPAGSIFDDGGGEAMRKVAIGMDAVARAISYAIAQPDGVDVSEIAVRPAASPY